MLWEWQQFYNMKMPGTIIEFIPDLPNSKRRRRVRSSMTSRGVTAWNISNFFLDRATYLAFLFWMHESGLSSVIPDFRFSKFHDSHVYILCGRCQCRVVLDVDLRPLACWDCGFVYNQEYVCVLWVLCFVRYGPCDEQICCPEEPYRLWCIWVSS